RPIKDAHGADTPKGGAAGGLGADEIREDESEDDGEGEPESEEDEDEEEEGEEDPDTRTKKTPKGRRGEDKEAKKERQRLQKEAAREKRKTKMPKAEKQAKIRKTKRVLLCIRFNNMPKAADPVVIPPLSNIDGKFSCIGNGLLYEGHPREKPEALRVLLMPTPGGEAIGDRSRPKAWWTAQAIFYELPCPKTASIPTIRALLEAAVKSNSLALPTKIKDLENKSNREFKKLNKEVLEKTGAGPSTGGPKASKPAEKASKTSEKASKPSEKATAKATAQKPAKMPKAAVEKVPKPTPAPKPPKAKAPAGTSASGAAGASKPSKSAPKAAQQDTKPKGKAKRKADEAFESQEMAGNQGSSPAKRPRPRKNPKPKVPVDPAPIPSSSWPTETYSSDGWGSSGSYHYDEDGDYMMGGEDYVEDDLDDLPPRDYAVPPPGSDFIAGSWVVSCPEIFSQWGYSGDFTSRYTFNIVRTNGRSHIAADFELGIVHGSLRSKTLEGRPDGAYTTFEWVGQEENGPVLPPRAEQSGYIKFLKDGTCRGKINGIDLCGDGVDFEAWWTGPPGRNELRWEDFDEEAYERAR
ncbi:hypothetical protein FRC01_011223, partial [Tulasnella sp. 417]